MKNIVSFQGFLDAYSRKQEPEGLQRLAALYWAFLVSSATIAICASVGYGMWQFLFTPQEAAHVADTKTITGFNREQLATIVEKLQKQQGDFGALQGE